jgi:hypothetical protein
MEMALAMRQLHTRGPACRGLVVDSDGVVLGADLVLVHRSPRGYRVVDETGRLLKLSFGERYDIGHLWMQLKGIERALNNGNLVKAQILGLQTPLAEISSDELVWLDRIATLLRYDPTQPRDNNGRWMTDGGGAGDAQQREALKPADPPSIDARAPSQIAPPSVATPAVEGLGPGVLGLLGRLAAAVSGPLLLGGVLALIPTNSSNIHEGDIPGRPDLSYRSDEGVLTIFRQDDQGNIQRVYEGFPDSAGLYHDRTGRVIGQHVGTGVVFNLESLPLFGGPLETASSDPDSGPASLPNSSTSTDDPESCPPPTIEIDNGKRSARAAAYQSQITGLLPGFDVLYNGVRFDGCDDVTQRMLEAKGHGNEWRFALYPESWIGENYYDETIGQAKRQNEASAGRGVDWHFADRGEALFFSLEFKAHHFDNIRVYYTEAVIKKTEDCMVWLKNMMDSDAKIEDTVALQVLSCRLEYSK